MGVKDEVGTQDDTDLSGETGMRDDMGEMDEVDARHLTSTRDEATNQIMHNSLHQSHHSHLWLLMHVNFRELMKSIRHN